MKNSILFISGLDVSGARGVSRLKSRIFSCALAVMLSISSGISADDTDLFFNPQSNVKPNILFVLDTSGSMASPGTSGERKIDELRTEMTALVSSLSGMNVGVVSYSLNNHFLNEIVDVDDATNKDALLQDIDALEPQGGTYTLAALWLAHEYFNGAQPEYSSPITHECQENHVILVTDGQPTQDDGELLDNGHGGTVGIVEDAIGRFCEQADVGGRVDNQNNGTCGAELGQYMFDFDHSGERGTNNVITHTVGFNFIDPWLATVSGNTVDEVTGDPVIGFGRHFDVSTSGALRDALDQILDGVSASFATPTISVNSYNESRHRDELFYALFQSKETVRWPGNIKKYRLGFVEDDAGELQAAVVDADGDPLVVQIETDGGDTIDSINPNSRSLWSGVVDGASIPEGGFAHKLPSFEERHWYTDYGNPVPFKVTFDGFDTTDIEDKLDLASVGAATDAERNTLVSWALGFDPTWDSAPSGVDTDLDGIDDLFDVDQTLGVDNNGDGVDDSVDQNHYYVGDSLHNSPLLLSYEATSTDPVSRKELLFAANNLGVLHAIDPETGVEQWSYTPEEHLGNIKKYFENTDSDGHVYGLDGEFTLHTTRTRPAGYDYQIEDAWLYMTERRGGNRVYALDVSNGTADPATDDPFSVMWKITGGGGDFVDLAQTWSKPDVVRVKYDCPDDCKTEELLMFSGGYNAAVYDDQSLDYEDLEAAVPVSDHGNAVYFVNPETGALVWSVGYGDHHSLNLPMKHSIPSTPVPVDTDLDGSIDLLFILDVAGNVFRVDFDSAATDLHEAGGQIADLSPTGQPLRFFNALDVAKNGSSYSTSHFYLVTGSGMRSSPLYEEPDNNRLYSIVDRWVHHAPYVVDDSGIKQSNYEYVASDTGARSIINADASVLRDVSADDTTTSLEYGFFKTFESGEKILQPTTIHRHRIFTTTFVPASDDGQPGCDYSIGKTRLYVNSLLSGENVLPEDWQDEWGIRTTGEYIEVGDGLLSGVRFLDTGEGDAPFFIIDKKVFAISELVAPDNSEVFRRFTRTGWVKQDDDH